MATQNLIQYLETSGYNALPNPGGVVAVGAEAMNRRQIETFIASEAIVVGDTLALDFSKTATGEKGIFVVKCDSGVATKKCGVGIAITAAAAGETVDAVIAGMVDNAKVAGATAIGDAMALSAATPGELAVYVNADVLPVFAIAATAHAAGTATVFVIKQM